MGRKRRNTHRRKPDTDRTLCGISLEKSQLAADPTCKNCLRAAGHRDCPDCKGSGWIRVKLPWTDNAKQACPICAVT